MASSSSSSTPSWKYDVFLSFRGKDTRKNFVDHLYSALEQQAIVTYKDDVTLPRGDIISPALYKAIETSKILVVVFSENYADSSWCLDELSHIMKCRDSETGQIVLPVFYHVEPSDVRKQKRKYGEAFSIHERSEKNKEKVESWKKALFDASNIAGWEPKHVANGHEAECIKEIVGSIFDKLLSIDPAVDHGDLVGLGTRLEELKSKLRIGSGGVRMVGIWGVGGGGKTTLATSIYKELKSSGLYMGCCFVENVREESGKPEGLKSLQEKILLKVFNKEMRLESVELGKDTMKGMFIRRNVLIVLDDVSHLDQLKALVGRHDWFGDKSRIIITTRDQHLLVSHRVDEVYEVSLLSRTEAIQLFRKHAYHENNRVEDFKEISLRVIFYANGHPLALKILGCFLCGRDKDEWLSTLARLKDHPDTDIMETLKISYDGLKDVEKELFLDIACFHRGQDMKYAMKILDACGFHPHIGVKVLIQKSLITISNYGKFDMHDIVQEMGHYIVRGEHPNNPEKHTRIWHKEDIEDICSRNSKEENNKIEGLQYYFYGHDDYPTFNMFVSNMKKLRLLRVWNTRNNDGGPSFLSNELRYLEWNRYPASPFPGSFQPKKLVVLKMSNSLQKELWNGDMYLPCLKELNLSGMRALVTTPDFGGLPCLQKLRLHFCQSLEEIHPSLGNHSSLVSVHVRDCPTLTRFPTIVRMEKLESLKIKDCDALFEFPKIEARMDNLKKLYLKQVRIEVLPSSVGEYCTNLFSLKLEDCEKLMCIEGDFDTLKYLEIFHGNLKYLCSYGEGFLSQLSRSLIKLNLSSRGLKDGEMPKEFGELSNLQELYLSDNHFTRLDFSLSRLTRLKLLDMSDCFNLIELPELPSSLAILNADWCESLEDVIRDEIHTNCKCLSQVSIKRGIWGKNENFIGGERLLETMLQGNDVESGCMSLDLKGSEIARGFEPRLVKRRSCRMQLPNNWCNDFSGFLFCVCHNSLHWNADITMTHVEKLEGYSQHDNDVVYWDEKNGYGNTWVRYISFDSLSHTTWWDPTSTSIHMKINNYKNDIIGWGWKLVPKRGGGQSSGQMNTHSSSSSSHISLHDDDYKCKLDILDDSNSTLECHIVQML